MEREHPSNDRWEESWKLMTIEKDEYTAYCHPDANGFIYVEGDSNPIAKIRVKHLDRAPFKYDVVIDSFPKDLASRFGRKFRDRVDTAYEAIEDALDSDSDNFLEEIKELDFEEVLNEEA